MLGTRLCAPSPQVLDVVKFCGFAGVLAGAIDYYILDKYQRLANTKPYDEVRSPSIPASIACCTVCLSAALMNVA